MKQAVNTTQSEPNQLKPMTEAQIDREFARTPGALKDFPRRAVTIPPSGPGEDAVEVGLNGHMFLIKRGERVELPEPLCEVLENAGVIRATCT